MYALIKYDCLVYLLPLEAINQHCFNDFIRDLVKQCVQTHSKQAKNTHVNLKRLIIFNNEVFEYRSFATSK